MSGKGFGASNTVKIVIAALGFLGIAVPAVLNYLGPSKPPVVSTRQVSKDQAKSEPHKRHKDKDKVFVGKPTDHFGTDSLIPLGFENLSVGMTAKELGDLTLLGKDPEPDHVGFNIQQPSPFTDGACWFDPNHEVVAQLKFELATGSYDTLKSEMVNAFGESDTDIEGNLTWRVKGLAAVLTTACLLITKPGH